jgi:putative transposase
VAFIDAHRQVFGVEPICRVLTEHGVKIAPSTYYAHRTRPVSERAERDALLLVEIERIYHHRDLGRGLAGARKTWRLLRRQLADGSIDTELAQRLGPVARCTVERLMGQAGLSGVRRGGRKIVTTQPDTSAPRPPDLVERDFRAEAPNRLWIVDFTYVPTWSGMAFTAFVTDVFSRRIVGWRTATRMPTDLPLDALEMALWTRQRAGHTDAHGRLPGLIQHSDAGSQGGLNRSSQHRAVAGTVAVR